MKYCNACGLKNADTLSVCRACGGALIKASDINNLLEEDTTRFTVSCCPNRKCKSLMALPNTKFCAQCGFKLQPISYELWLGKYVKPSLEDDPVGVLLESPNLFAPISEMGLSRRKAKEHLSRLVEEHTGVSQGVLDGWIRETTELFAKGEDKLEAVKQHAIRQAQKLNISLSDSTAIVERLARSTLSPPNDAAPAPPPQTVSSMPSDGVASFQQSAGVERKTRVYTLRKKRSVEEKSEHRRPQDSAHAFYENLVRGGVVSPAPVYLNPDGGERPAGAIQNGDIYLVEGADEKSVFVLFSDADGRGWIFPNPHQNELDTAFQFIFPQLTGKKFERGIADVRPVSVSRLSGGRWKVDSQSQSTTINVIEPAPQARAGAKSEPENSPAEKKASDPKLSDPPEAKTVEPVTEQPSVSERTASNLRTGNRLGGRSVNKYRLLVILLATVVILFIALLIFSRS